MSNLIDTGWAAWLPFELIEALEARSGRSADRRALRERLEREFDLTLISTAVIVTIAMFETLYYVMG